MIEDAPTWRAALWRGLRQHCPRCDDAALFASGREMARQCPTCGLDFERNPGAYIGGIGLNTSVTFILLVLAIIVSLLVIDGPWQLQIIPPLVVAVVVPLAFFRASKTVWIAIELIFLPPEPWD